MPDHDAILKRAEEAEERASKATEGPWVADYTDSPFVAESRYSIELVDAKGGLGRGAICCLIDCGRESDIIFIEHARTDIPALAADVRALLEEVERLRKNTVPCADCGTLVHTDGCEMSDGSWVCSEACWDVTANRRDVEE